MTTSPKWRWQNVPVPEVHVAALVIGVTLHVAWPRPITTKRSPRLVGVLFVVAGAAGAAWATRTAGRVDLEQPKRLVTDGPYAVCRHPMYVAWTFIYVGVALALNTLWLLIVAPIVAVLVDREARSEERRLVNAFGDEYLSYQQGVRRYL